jgi:hypothetical protein
LTEVCTGFTQRHIRTSNGQPPLLELLNHGQNLEAPPQAPPESKLSGLFFFFIFTRRVKTKKIMTQAASSIAGFMAFSSIGIRIWSFLYSLNLLLQFDVTTTGVYASQ